MAFFQEQDEDELNPEQQGGGVATSQASGMVGSGAPAQAQGATQQGAAPTPDNPGNFAGIKTYLDANKSQASKLGDQASGVINQSADQARAGVNELDQSFNQAAGGPVVFNPDATNKIAQGAEKLADDERAQIKTQYNAQYKGPMDLTDSTLQPQYTEAQKKLNAAKTNVQSSGTEEGRKGLITQINEKPRTQGITNFDNILLQSGTGREKLAQAATANQDVTQDVLTEKNALAAQKAAANKAAADAARTQTQKAVGDATGAFTKQFDPNDPNSKLAQAISRALKANNSVAEDLGDDAYSLDAQTMEKFGLSEGQNSFGLDPSAYFQQAEIDKINAGTVASQEDYARAAALADLAGGDAFLDQANIGQAGTAGQYEGKIDKEKLGADIGAKKEAYDKTYKSGKGSLNSFMDPAVVQGVGHGSSFGAADGQKILSATPEEIEKVWIPKYKQEVSRRGGDPLYSGLLKELTGSLAKWQNSQGYNKTFKKNKEA